MKFEEIAPSPYDNRIELAEWESFEDYSARVLAALARGIWREDATRFAERIRRAFQVCR